MLKFVHVSDFSEVFEMLDPETENELVYQVALVRREGSYEGRSKCFAT